MSRHPSAASVSRPAEKPVGWRGSSRKDVRDFPDDARTEAGYQLHLLQQGKQPDDWKPMATVGAGVYELRIHTATEYRVLVVTRFAEAIYTRSRRNRRRRQNTISSWLDIAIATLSRDGRNDNEIGQAGKKVIRKTSGRRSARSCGPFAVAEFRARHAVWRQCVRRSWLLS
jgi:phage-related protein